MKYTLLLAAFALTWLSSCQRDKFYTCYCTSTDTAEAFRIGRVAENTAYAECRQHQDSSHGITCFMAVMK